MTFTHEESINEQNEMIDFLHSIGKGQKKRRSRKNRFKNKNNNDNNDNNDNKNNEPILSMPDITSVFSSISFDELQKKFIFLNIFLFIYFMIIKHFNFKNNK